MYMSPNNSDFYSHGYEANRCITSPVRENGVRGDDALRGLLGCNGNATLLGGMCGSRSLWSPALHWFTQVCCPRCRMVLRA
jgi:hypothetical protein